MAMAGRMQRPNIAMNVIEIAEFTIHSRDKCAGMYIKEECLKMVDCYRIRERVLRLT